MRILKGRFEDGITVGQRLQFCRMRSGLKQKEFADELNVSPSTISKWETNVTMPPSDKLSDISRILGVSIDMLLGGGSSEEE